MDGYPPINLGQVSNKSTEEYYPEVVFMAVVGARPIKLHSEEKVRQKHTGGIRCGLVR